MAQVTITINGRHYPVACNEGQQERILELARYVEGKVQHFVHELGQIGEARLLVLAALILADELAEAGWGEADWSGAATNGAAAGADALAGNVENLAARIEAIAARLETPHI